MYEIPIVARDVIMLTHEVEYVQLAQSSIIHGSADTRQSISSQVGEILLVLSMPLRKQTGMKISSNVCQP